jgi:hypothetical protein
MTDGSHIHPDKYLGVAGVDRPPIPSGPSAVFPGCYNRTPLKKSHPEN